MSRRVVSTFVEDLAGTLQVIAKDTKIQVEFNPEVVSRYRLLGYENRRVADQDFRDNTVDAGDVGAGHSVTALYELKLRDGARGNLGTVFVRYEDPNDSVIVELERSLSRRLRRANRPGALKTQLPGSSYRPWLPSTRKFYGAATGPRRATLATWPRTLAGYGGC